MLTEKRNKRKNHIPKFSLTSLNQKIRDVGFHQFPAISDFRNSADNTLSERASKMFEISIIQIKNKTAKAESLTPAAPKVRRQHFSSPSISNNDIPRKLKRDNDGSASDCDSSLSSAPTHQRAIKAEAETDHLLCIYQEEKAKVGDLLKLEGEIGNLTMDEERWGSEETKMIKE